MLVPFLVLTALCSIISLYRNRNELPLLKAVELVLSYVLFINVGLAGCWAFVGHAFFPDRVAASIGWATGSPFQFEVAVANLAFGILGVLCIRVRDGFWLATGIGYAVFLFGAGYGHIREIISSGNHSVNNAGPVLYVGDIAVPAVILLLLLARWKLQRSP
jgi:hypothetical protein